MSPLLPEHDRERGCKAYHSPHFLLTSSLLPSQQEQQRHCLPWVPSKTSQSSFGPSPLALLFGSAISPWGSSAARHFAQRGLAALALIEIIVGLLGASAAFGIFIYQSLIDGPHQALLISFLRLAFLLFVGVLTFRAFGQQADGFGHLGRASLCRVAILAQLLWFASELVLGSALVTFYPIVKGPRADLQALSEASGLAYRGSSVVYLLAMTGCLGFLSHLGRRRSSGAPMGGHYRPNAVVPSGCCGFGSMPACRVPSSGSASGGSGSSSSPAGSEAGSFSSSSSALFYPDAGLNSPTGPLGAGGSTATSGAASAGHAICSIVLVEHEVSGSPDGRGLFVHKQGLRPIRTRPDDAARPYVPLLKPIISNSFSCDPSAAASLRGGLGVAASGSSFSTSGGGSGSVVSSVQASGGSFQFATSVSAPLPPHRYAL